MYSYVCSKNVTNYEHFGDLRTTGNTNRCPLHDNVEARHEEEVRKAAADALAKVRAENPHISEAELMIQVSDRVKQAEQARKGRADTEHVGFPFHMMGNQLVQGLPGQGLVAGLAQVPAPRPIIHQQVRHPVQMPGRPHFPRPVPIHGGPARDHNPFGIPGIPQIPQIPRQVVPPGGPPPGGNPLENLYVFNPQPGPGQYGYLLRNRQLPPNRHR
jgi:TRIAD3 protein (E3 ubiquitin-protein ligase RNF216)